MLGLVEVIHEVKEVTPSRVIVAVGHVLDQNELPVTKDLTFPALVNLTNRGAVTFTLSRYSLTTAIYNTSRNSLDGVLLVLVCSNKTNQFSNLCTLGKSAQSLSYIHISFSLIPGKASDVSSEA